MGQERAAREKGERAASSGQASGRAGERVGRLVVRRASEQTSKWADVRAGDEQVVR